MGPENSVEKLPHHEQMSFCLTRAKYRQGRKLTAVKVYTVNDESKYLIMVGIPAIKIASELENLCLRYGDVELIHELMDYPREEFTEAYLVKYKRIKNARFAKGKIDGKNFYGGLLHVCYAPELESVDEAREKLHERRKSIAALTKYNQDADSVNTTKKTGVSMHGNSKKYLSRLKSESQRSHLQNWSNVGTLGSIEQFANIERGKEETLSQTISTPIDFIVNHSLSQESRMTLETDIKPSCSNSDIHIQLDVDTFPQKKRASMLPLIENRKKIKLFEGKKLLLHKKN